MSSDQPRDDDLRRTTDPALVRSIVEERGGFPAHEPGTEGQGDRGLLRIGRRGGDEDLTEVSWETFEDEFEEKDLEFVYPDDGSEADGIGTLQKVSRE